MNEKIIAGERAINSLREAKEFLSSSSNMSILAIYGGNCITYQKVENAIKVMDRAIENLMVFRDELFGMPEIYDAMDAEAKVLDSSTENINEDFFIQVNYRHPKGCQLPGFVENCFQHY